MKNLKFSLSALIYNLTMCVLLAIVMFPFVGIIGLIPAGILFLYGCVPSNSIVNTHALNSEVIRRMFSADLQKNLYPDGEFYKNSKVDDGIAIDSESVDVPQAGAPPKVIKNPTQRPIPLRNRKDDKKSYSVDLFETEPDIVTNINQSIVSYDKRAAVLEDHISTLNQRVADEMAIRWFPTKGSNLIRTSGTANTGSKVTGMVGSRKELAYQDFIDLAALMDRMNVPDDGKRCLLIYSDQVAEIKKIPEFRDYDKTGVVGNLSTGSIGRIQNFNIYKRSVTPVVSTGLVVNPYGAAVAATDNLAVLAWHPSFVRRAEGAAEVYYDGVVRPGFGGPTMSAAVRGGGMISRLDEVGVAAIIQQ